jgi:hypothetical protein
MNLLALALRIHVPHSLKKQKLRELFEATAAAFGRPVPQLENLSFDECLRRYARFTKEEIEQRIRVAEDMGEIKKRLYEHACRLGEEIRARLHLSAPVDAASVGRVLYKALGIDFQASATGDVTINSCYFSAYYSVDVCCVMSALDEGIAAGLTGGRTLVFSRRITEGHPSCTAVLVPKG